MVCVRGHGALNRQRPPGAAKFLQACINRQARSSRNNRPGIGPGAMILRQINVLWGSPGKVPGDLNIQQWSVDSAKEGPIMGGTPAGEGYLGSFKEG